MNRDWLFKHGWLFAWLAPVVTSYLTRGLLPIDETRYLGVAWEMWQRDDFLVPYLNGVPYSHKPPLMFWLFQAGWSIFGVNEWWPRLVPSLFTLAGLYFTQAMARKLWPDRPRAAILAPWILCSSFYWALFTAATMFDMLLMAMVMLALLGLLLADTGRQTSGWLLLGFASGLGILIKGPVMLLHIAFPALLAPWWSKMARHRPLYWYGCLLGAVTLAVVIALAWALPAASAGGPAYEHAILWHQTTDRMVSSFAHRRPFWWYLPLLPLMLFPWFIWPPLWRSLAVLRRGQDRSMRFLLTWLLPTFIVFSLISGKQPHYLLPLFPGFALLAARALDGYERGAGRLAQVPPALLMGVVGLALLLLPLLPFKWLPDWTKAISPFWGAAILVVSTALFTRLWERASHAVVTLALTGTTMMVLLVSGILLATQPIFDTTSVAHLLSQLQEKDVPIAHVGDYHDEFHFLGRLEKPLTQIREKELPVWCHSHPDGYVVTYKREAPANSGAQPVYTQRYRGKWLSVWPVERMTGSS